MSVLGKEPDERRGDTLERNVSLRLLASPVGFLWRGVDTRSTLVEGGRLSTMMTRARATMYFEVSRELERDDFDRFRPARHARFFFFFNFSYQRNGTRTRTKTRRHRAVVPRPPCLRMDTRRIMAMIGTNGTKVPATNKR